MPRNHILATAFFLSSIFLWQPFMYAQKPSFPIDDWVKKLSDKTDVRSRGYLEVDSTLYSYYLHNAQDSVTVLNALAALEKKGNARNDFFRIRMRLLRMPWVTPGGYKGLPRAKQLMQETINECYALNNDLLTAIVSWQYGSAMNGYGELGLSALYSLNGAELFEKNGIALQKGEYNALGTVLYNTREYEKSIYYMRQMMALTNKVHTTLPGQATIISTYNTIGLCYRKMLRYDSAFIYFDSAMQYAGIFNNKAWKAIVSGNKAQIYFTQQKYDTAKALFEYDYKGSVASGEVGDAGNALLFLAKISLVKGENAQALQQLRTAVKMLEFQPPAYYLQHIYETSAAVYRALGNKDSALLYTQLFTHLRDSLEQVALNSRMEVSAIKLENMNNSFKIQNLQNKIETEALKRNFIILALLLISAIVILYFNRKRIQARLKEQLAAQQKAAMEAEMQSAREQIQLFTQTLVEKTNLVEKLESQLHNKTATPEHQQLMHELTHNAILTETDWDKFKTLFEKACPGFFANLKNTIPDITTAEQRMAAFTRLQLTSKQIAALLGISANSVVKTRSRLRQRFGLNTDAEVLEFIAGM
ncbi:MAG TPA: hypothetical protein VFW07_10840 [Parafilimonas sp.]|nr:hypothetical protein [Parafilimonas sp.]